MGHFFFFLATSSNTYLPQSHIKYARIFVSENLPKSVEMCTQAQGANPKWRCFGICFWNFIIITCHENWKDGWQTCHIHLSFLDTAHIFNGCLYIWMYLFVLYIPMQRYNRVYCNKKTLTRLKKQLLKSQENFFNSLWVIVLRVIELLLFSK